ncbi:hypothetical protein YIM_37035 [Amycolatopsis sp. YIM 10]|nr:hypothetical protein YIM_37035 [Amycolatopsis sp. YIM 10]
MPDSTSVAAARPPSFEDFPGEGIVYTDTGMRLGVKVKAIDSTWAPEVMDKPASPGRHYLAVWIAATPELPDRGTNDVSIEQKLYVRYKPADGTCGSGTSDTPDSSGYCFASGWPGSGLVVLEDDNWREHRWEQQTYTSSDIGRGETRIGQIGFEIDETVQATDFGLCAPTREEFYSPSFFPCTAFKAPDGPA